MRTAILAALTLAACNRPASLSSTATSATASASPAPPEPVASAASSATLGVPGGALDDVLGARPREAQAHEATLAHPGYRALLAPVMDMVAARFEGVPDEQVRLQVVPIQGEARAVFAFAPGSKARPLLMAFDEQRSMSWFKERPIHDLDPSIASFALCPGPAGELLLIFHDPPTGSLGARRWDQGGGLLADFRLGMLDRIDSLGALYWPERGWLIAYGFAGSLKGQLFSERGKLTWGSDGKILATGVQPGPLRLLLDTAVSSVIVWPGSGSTGRHHLATRVDLDGQPLWRTPVDLGDAADSGAPSLTRIAIGTTRAHLPGKTAPYTVDITPEGRVLIQ